MRPLDKYRRALQNLPNRGDGLNLAILGTANHGVYAGIDAAQIHADIQAHSPATDKETSRAVSKAQSDKGNSTGTYRLTPPKKSPPSFDGDAALNRIIAMGAGTTEADIVAASPIPIDMKMGEDPRHMLSHLYTPDDLLFMGSRYTPGTLHKSIRSAADWIRYFTDGGRTSPHLIPNPLTGQQGLTKEGKPTLRGDNCIKSFRFATAEFDNISHADQMAFWWGVNLPVAALIDSGGKSLHAWVKIDGVETAEEWADQVEEELFKDLLVPLGVDGACKNEARLSRLPGHMRDKGRMQKLIYLAPGGRRVNDEN